MSTTRRCHIQCAEGATKISGDDLYTCGLNGEWGPSDSPLVRESAA
eukprot:COSAG01_NODE_61953_length_287_cov_0.547872_1_plen_45_part_10